MLCLCSMQFGCAWRQAGATISRFGGLNGIDASPDGPQAALPFDFVDFAYGLAIKLVAANQPRLMG